MEIWKDIKGYENYYQVSNFGNVRSLYIGMNYKKTRVPYKNPNGYLTVCLSKYGKSKNYYIHRLVAETFLSNLDNKKEVNHIDGNKENNIVDNLEWVTPSENIQHAWENGLCKRPNKQVCYKTRKQVLQFDKDNNYLKTWNGLVEIENELGIKQSLISRCCHGRAKTCNGFIWKFQNSI